MIPRDPQLLTARCVRILIDSSRQNPDGSPGEHASQYPDGAIRPARPLRSPASRAVRRRAAAGRRPARRRRPGCEGRLTSAVSSLSAAPMSWKGLPVVTNPPPRHWRILLFRRSGWLLHDV